MQHLANKNKPIYLGVALFLIAALILTIIRGQQKNEPALPAFTMPGSAETIEMTMTEPMATYETYEQEAPHLTIAYPEGWTRVNTNNGVSFICQADKSTLSLERLEYFGAINAITSENIEIDIANAGGRFLSYVKIDNSSYLCEYLMADCYYAEYTTWDLNDVYRLSFTCLVEREDYYLQTVSDILNSFQWEKGSSIPEDYYLFYNAIGNFEFGVPAEWNSGIKEDSFFAASEAGSTMQCNVTECEFNPEDITPTYYEEFMRSSHEDFKLTFFTNTNGAITAEGTYFIGDTAYHIVSNILYNNGFLYEFSFGALDTEFETDYPIYLNCVSLFRLF